RYHQDSIQANISRFSARLKISLNVCRTGGGKFHQGYTQRGGRWAQYLKHGGNTGVTLLIGYPYSFGLWHQLVQDLQTFDRDVRARETHPGDIPARLAYILDQG